MNELSSQRIVVTRPSHQAEELARPLRELGAEVILLPVIEIAPPGNPEPLRNAVSRLDEYDWIVFSSANAVSALAGEAGRRHAPPNARIAAVGPATREAVEELGWKVDIVPEKFVAESLVSAIPPEALRGRRVLIPSAAVTRDVIRNALINEGAHVDVIEAYRNVVPEHVREQAIQVFSSERVPDWVTFASSSAVDNLVSFVGACRLAGVKLASIGPITSDTIRKHGLDIHAQPDDHTIPGLVEAIRQAVYCSPPPQ